MRDSLKDYIFTKKIIPEEVCSDLIKDIQGLDWRTHTWYNSKLDKHIDGYNELKIAFSEKEQREKLKPYLTNLILEYQDIQKTNIIVNNISRIRFNKYEVGSEMKTHYDLIRDIFTEKNSGVPILSIVGNLNEDYEGSEFYMKEEKIDLKTGDVLIFPSTFIYPHKVTKTTKGTRYSFVAWAY